MLKMSALGCAPFRASFPRQTDNRVVKLTRLRNKRFARLSEPCAGWHPLDRLVHGALTLSLDKGSMRKAATTRRALSRPTE
jgi:hypothetical protein